MTAFDLENTYLFIDGAGADERACATGARITQEPTDADPEGHLWIFAENMPQKS